jgi:hypothetical protein
MSGGRHSPSQSCFRCGARDVEAPVSVLHTAWHLDEFWRRYPSAVGSTKHSEHAIPLSIVFRHGIIPSASAPQLSLLSPTQSISESGTKPAPCDSVATLRRSLGGIARFPATVPPGRLRGRFRFRHCDQVLFPHHGAGTDFDARQSTVSKPPAYRPGAHAPEKCRRAFN